MCALVFAWASLLTAANTDVNQPEADGTTALDRAVREDDVKAAQTLLRAGANPKAANRYGVTPLFLAATNGNAAMTESLLKAGADANAADGAGPTDNS